jgi:uncharacterized membrane protein
MEKGKTSKTLLIGESRFSIKQYYKGFNQIVMAEYENSVRDFEKIMNKNNVKFEHMTCHEAHNDFPTSLKELEYVSTIILSDIGADTFLLHPLTFKGEILPNRLELLAEFVKKGGGLIMAGGYMSFQGINGVARYYQSPLAKVLPVNMQPYDDRCECPEGVEPIVINSDHQITTGLPKKWPPLLGYNKVSPKSDTKVTTLVMVGSDPLLVLGSYGKGRTIAYTSDLAPHWCPTTFSHWDGFGTIWKRMINWASKGETD